MKKIHLIPNVLTAFGLMCGLFAIFKLNMTEVGEASEKVLQTSALLLLLAGFFDLLDGALARALKAESEFGGIFDSMADAVSFGVAPSVIILKSVSASPGTIFSFLMTTAALVFSVCGVLRLVRYNVLSNKAKGDVELELAHKQNFTGLPIPAAAACAITLNLFLLSPDTSGWLNLSDPGRAIVLFFGMVLLGYLMISRWKFPSSKRLRVRLSSFQLVFILVIAAVFIFYGLLHHTAIVVFLLSWAYVVTAMILSLIRVIMMRKTNNLEDFEPDEDDLFDQTDLD